MGLTQLNPLLAVSKGASACVAGCFDTVNGAAPTVIEGDGFTVARTAEGVWTVTLNDTPNAIKSIVAWAELKTADDVGICQGDIDERAAAAFRIQLWVAPAPATPVFALADEPGTRINFIAFLRNTNVS